MKKIIATITLFSSFLFASPAFAYTVKNGDTMSQIASESNLTLQELAAMNPQIQNLDQINIGQTINTELPQKTVSLPEQVIYSDNTIDQLDRLVIADAQMKEEVNPQIQDVKVDEPVNAETPKKPVSTPEKASYSDYEIDLLARLVRAEAQIEPFEGKIAVACVVLNRLKSSHFPKTIKEVIYQRGQFQPVSNGEINKPADSESTAAVKAALTEKRNMAHESLFFYNPAIATSHWLASRATTLVIGQHVFKK